MQIHLEAKLRKQQMESEVDSRWLQQEENNLVNIFTCSLFQLPFVLTVNIHFLLEKSSQLHYIWDCWLWQRTFIRKLFAKSSIFTTKFNIGTSQSRWLSTDTDSNNIRFTAAYTRLKSRNITLIEQCFPRTFHNIRIVWREIGTDETTWPDKWFCLFGYNECGQSHHGIKSGCWKSRGTGLFRLSQECWIRVKSTVGVSGWIIIYFSIASA